MDKAHFKLEGLDTPIVTRIRETRESGMTVEQSLPFLRLQTGVRDGDDNRAHIESVSLVVCDGIPRLVLDLAYDDVAAAPPVAPPESPEAQVAEAYNPRAGVARSRRPDQTLDYDTPAPEPTAAPVPEQEHFSIADDGPREPTQVFRTHAGEADEPARREAMELALEEQLMLSAKPSYRLAQRWARVQPLVRRAAAGAMVYSLRAARWAWPRVLNALRAAIGMSARLAASARTRLKRPA